jgi:hypothetical protein
LQTVGGNFENTKLSFMKKLILIHAFLTIGLSGFCQNHDIALSQDTQEMINGCKKIVKHVSTVNHLLNWTEWEKKYLISETQTCDFSAYIITYRVFKNEKLAEQSQFVAGCDECDETPCGTWIYYGKSGKIKKKIEKGNCNLKQFDVKR